jgi:hypothetical protein
VKYLESVTQICVGVWVGTMTGFAVTAPQVFAAFGTNRQGAGDLAGQMIVRLNGIGLVLGLVALLAIAPRLKRGLNRWRTGLLTLALALSVFGTLYIFPQMAKAQPANPIQTYAETDPVRVAYNRWHDRSRQVFGLAIVLRAFVVILGPIGSER